MTVTLTVVLLLGLAVAVGSVVQSAVGFGLAVVAAPFVVLAEPDLMPGALLVCGMVLPLGELLTGERDIDRRMLTGALSTRLLFTPAGALLVAWAGTREIALIVGVMVLLVVGVSLTRWSVRATMPNALAAGAVSGISGTAAAIGGPFLAMVLQHERPARIRSTLAAFFVVGSLTGLLALAIAGELTRDQILAGLLWVPFLALGAWLGRPVRRAVGPARMRTAVLAFCAIASLVVIARALLQ
ncbi:MAG: sulfite exporter TauE/SafE family protein [Actinomycetia bacterium]|nr:sulfite exporter TauE/SafE family protein [Actinomycetes bacterium]